MGQCGITSSKTVLVFLNLIFWVSVAGGRERAGGRPCGPKEASAEAPMGPSGDPGWAGAGAEEVRERGGPVAEARGPLRCH